MAGTIYATDADREEIGRQVAEGYTSGRITGSEGAELAWCIEIDRVDEDETHADHAERGEKVEGCDECDEDEE